MKPKFFRSSADFRKWLEKNRDKETELTVGFYKVNSGKKSMTWSEAVDQALCFGWIDSVRNSIDEESYSNRFTRRKPTSNWSNININKVKELTEKGLMHPAGLEAFNKRKKEKTGIYSFENETKKLPASFEKQIKANKKAWGFYTKQPPWYKKVIAHWILTAKRDETKTSRLNKLIAASEEQKRVL